MAKSAKEVWERPDPLPMGDDSVWPIYTNVGIAMSRFEMLQDAMNCLLIAIVGSPPSTLYRAVGTLIDAITKKRMIEAAADDRFPYDRRNKKKGQERTENQVKRDTVGEFMKQYEALSLRRNEIAHGLVVHHTANNKDRGVFLVPGHHATRYNRLLPKDPVWLGDYRYTSAQIKQSGHEFTRLEHEVREFIKNLRHKPTVDSPVPSQKISAEQARAIVRIPTRHK